MGLAVTPHRSAGFTLVELVIALTLTALLLAALGSALHGLGHGFARSTAQADRFDRVLRVSLALRNSLLRTTGTPYASVHRSPPLTGTSDRLEWLATLPDSSPVQGLYRWRLFVRDGALIAEIDDPLGASPPPLPPTTLVDDLLALSIEYQEAANGLWLDRWDAPHPPLRLRLRIVTQADGSWPPLILAIGWPA